MFLVDVSPGEPSFTASIIGEDELCRREDGVVEGIKTAALDDLLPTHGRGFVRRTGNRALESAMESKDGQRQRHSPSIAIRGADIGVAVTSRK